MKNIKDYTLDELALFKDALYSAKVIYENDMQPLYGQANSFNKLTKEQMRQKDEYAEINAYYRNVTLTLKDKVLEIIKNNGKDAKKTQKKD